MISPALKTKAGDILLVTPADRGHSDQPLSARGLGQGQDPK
jgi:hypothetical protein